MSVTSFALSIVVAVTTKLETSFANLLTKIIFSRETVGEQYLIHKIALTKLCVGLAGHRRNV